MRNLQFHILDVFAESKYAGNQLAVVRHAGSLSADLMQKIAREMNFSETSFVLSDAPREGGYDVRIFTPNHEVPFAGHPTLGTAHLIMTEILETDSGEVTLNLGVGPIRVWREAAGGDGLLWMRQRAPEFGSTFEASDVADSLGLSTDDVDSRIPIQAVSTGLPFIIAPLRTLDAVRRARIRPDQFERLVADAEAKFILLFAPECYDARNQINARMFAPSAGVPEDPATGSANGCLAAYLVQHRFFGSDEIAVRVEQGCEIGRPSLLHLRARRDGASIEVLVGGKVVLVARGELL